jgi:hypothetical protein
LIKEALHGPLHFLMRAEVRRRQADAEVAAAGDASGEDRTS